MGISSPYGSGSNLTAHRKRQTGCAWSISEQVEALRTAWKDSRQCHRLSGDGQPGKTGNKGKSWAHDRLRDVREFDSLLVHESGERAIAVSISGRVAPSTP